ncbi:MAG: hypothetical protein ACRDQD_00685 [Nocardioidaceae bacterium]
MPTEPVVLSRKDFDDLQKLLGFTPEEVYAEGYFEAHVDGVVYRTSLPKEEG